jgi:hypothetical protein
MQKPKQASEYYTQVNKAPYQISWLYSSTGLFSLYDWVAASAIFRAPIPSTAVIGGSFQFKTFPTKLSS